MPVDSTFTFGHGRSIAARKRQTPTDLYQTPEWATRALLSVEDFDGEVWEPCSGLGAMSRVLEQAGLDVTSSDILPEGYGQGGVDFLHEQRRMSHIVTNPPYRDALPIIRHALTLAEHKAAFLLKLTFLESQKRKAFFKEKPPARVWVFSNRVTMWPHGEDEPKNGGTIAYAWFVWDHQSDQRGQLGWL